jgi:hypothetical protein
MYMLAAFRKIISQLAVGLRAEVCENIGMCFSATASFASGTALSAAGVSTLAKTETREDIPIAAIPLLFGAQQILEGVVWLSLSRVDQTCTKIPAYGFLFFAFILWPVFIPFVAARGEQDAFRKRLFVPFKLGGIAVALYYLYFMFYSPLITRVAGHSIVYYIASPQNYAVAGIYVLITCGSLLLSSRNILKLFGILTSVAFVATYYFYHVTLTSVWCFFAAILSAVIYWYFWSKRKK